MKSKAIGSISIHRISEIDRIAVQADKFFAGISPETIARARRSLDDRFIDPEADAIAISFHSFVIESDGKRILVDTCHGNDKPRSGNIGYANALQTDYLANLASAGFRPEDIDIVLCTHLHYDHVGWNTRLDNGRWVPTFPNARYVMSRTDFDHFSCLAEDSCETHHRPAFVDSVLPVVEAGQADLIGSEQVANCDLARGLRLEEAPGHTPGSVLLWIENIYGRAVVSGDVVHHPIQILEPTLHVEGEHDTAQATATRIGLLERWADSGTLLLPAHFPAPTAGWVVWEKDGFRFDCEAR